MESILVFAAMYDPDVIARSDCWSDSLATTMAQDMALAGCKSQSCRREGRALALLQGGCSIPEAGLAGLAAECAQGDARHRYRLAPGIQQPDIVNPLLAHDLQGSSRVWGAVLS